VLAAHSNNYSGPFLCLTTSCHHVNISQTKIAVGSTPIETRLEGFMFFAHCEPANVQAPQTRTAQKMGKATDSSPPIAVGAEADDHLIYSVSF